MRLINGKRFEPGPFNLGRYGPVIGSVAVMWVIFITVRACSLDASKDSYITMALLLIPSITKVLNANWESSTLSASQQCAIVTECI